MSFILVIIDKKLCNVGDRERLSLCVGVLFTEYKLLVADLRSSCQASAKFKAPNTFFFKFACFSTWTNS